jgi:hypothetical protein
MYSYWHLSTMIHNVHLLRLFSALFQLTFTPETMKLSYILQGKRVQS